METIEGLYKPFNNDDAIRYGDARSATLSQPINNYPGAGNIYQDF